MSQNDPLDRRASSQMSLNSASQVCVARELNTLHEQQNVKKKRQIILEKIRKSVLSEHGNMVFQLLENGPEKFILNANLLEKL